MTHGASPAYTYHTIDIATAADADAAAREFAALLGGRRPIVAFDAPMGAGKTTFIAALCRALGVDGADATASPTFALVNEYASPGGAVYHFDLYRLGSVAEALEIGAADYLESGNMCLIEWPEAVEPLLRPDVTVWVRIEVMPGGARRLVAAFPAR